MVQVSRLYTRELFGQFKYRGTWLPNSNIRLGDVGLLENDRFALETTLEKLRVPVNVRKGVNPTTFEYMSKSGISVDVKAAGKAAAAVSSLGQAQAGIRVQFNKKGSFLFQARGCQEDMIENRDEIGDAILKLRRKREWNDDWRVVTELVRADCATILASVSRDAAIELGAKTNVTIADLANVNVGLKVASESGRIVKFVAKKKLKPLYNVCGLWSSIASKLGLGSKQFRSYHLVGSGSSVGGFPSGNSLAAQGPLMIVEPDWDDSTKQSVEAGDD